MTVAPDLVAPELVALAHRLADTSGQVIRPLFRQRIDVIHKQGKRDFDPVTEADRGAERAIRELLTRERPDDGVLGEEYGERNGSSGYRWVLDPVDGTRAFITGRHEWGSLIALEQDGMPILGILDQPVLGERFIGVNGASHLIQAGQASPLKVRGCSGLK
jgi:myo-inositol-1(or 4)-monophosphatase